MMSSMSGQFSLMRRRVVGLCNGGGSSGFATAMPTTEVLFARTVKVMNVPFDATRETILSALSDKGVAPRDVKLVYRTNQRFNGMARVMFDSTEQAKEATKAIRSMEMSGRGLKAYMLKPPPQVEQTAPDAMAEIMREDPLQVFLNDTFERQMPTLDSVRETLLENDQHGILRSWRLPGLTLPEWDDDPVPTTIDVEDNSEVKEEDAAEVMGQWAETIVKVDRVQKVVKGGSIMKCRALVVVGNLMGAGGFAYGKGATPADAVARASAKAKRNLFYADRYRGVALTHDVRGQHNNCHVNIFATPPGSRMVGSRLGMQLLKQMGFASFTIKAHGRRSPASYIYATFDALTKLTSVADIARKRGRRILEIEHVLKGGRQYAR